MNDNDNFRYLHIGLPDEVRRLKEWGDLEGAARAADRYLASPSVPADVKCCLTAQKEMMRRMPADYQLSRDDALALVHAHIPDFTEAEFDELCEAGRIGWLYLQGERRYFGRFFENLCKVDRQFAQRAGLTVAGAELTAGVEAPKARAMRLMQERGGLCARIRCRASLRVKDAFFQAGDTLRAYLPFPREFAAQGDVKIESVSPEPTLVTAPDAPQRVVFWQRQMQDNQPFTVEFSYTRRADYVDLSRPPSFCPTLTDAERTRWTAERLPHVIFTPFLRELASTLAAGAVTHLEKARRFYDFITLNVKYSFMPSYFCLEDIAGSCARNLVGDCGVQALLFITLCRCVGVPARWESGWQAESNFCGAHDWSMFYAEPFGWLYADPSMGGAAVREHNEPKRLHYFGNLDPFRMAANAEFAADFGVPKDRWRADPYDNQLGEMETLTRALTYDEYERGKEVLELTELP